MPIIECDWFKFVFLNALIKSSKRTSATLKQERAQALHMIGKYANFDLSRKNYAFIDTWTFAIKNFERRQCYIRTSVKWNQIQKTTDFIVESLQNRRKLWTKV